MEEIWKDIEGFEGLYQVSNTGKVKSFAISKLHYWQNEHLMKPVLRNGYYYVYLCHKRENGIKRGKHYLVHRLVAKAFVDNPFPNEYKYVNHKDENKVNNNAHNLEWCDIKYNNSYGTCKLRRNIAHGRKIEQLSLDGVPIAMYYSLSIASEITGVYKRSINNCCNGVYKQAGGYKWRYVE